MNRISEKFKNIDLGPIKASLIRLGEGNLIFSGWIIISGWLVGKTLIIIFSFRIATSKNKNSDHRVQ